LGAKANAGRGNGKQKGEKKSTINASQQN